MRRTLVALAVCGVAAAALAGTPDTAVGDTVKGADDVAALSGALDTRPNIILLMTDDQRPNEMRFLRATRRLLGRGGTTYRNAIAPNPICCPARASLFTGQYSQNHRVLTAGGGAVGGFRAFRTSGRNMDNNLGSWLQAAGYTTGYQGKFLNGYNIRSAQRAGFSKGDGYGPKGWDYWDAYLRGGTKYYNFTYAADGAVKRYHEGQYTTHVTTERALDRINDWAPDSAPFYLNLFYTAAHKDWDNDEGKQALPDPERKYRGTVSSINPSTKSPAFNEKDMRDKPPHYRNRPKLGRAMLQKYWERRGEVFKSVDDSVRAIVRRLAALGELDNTVIMYTADNGFALGEHRWLGKRWSFQPEMRVPLYIRGPGFRAGARAGRFTTQPDIVATVLDLANARPGRTIDGRSVLARSPRRAIPIGSGNRDARSVTDMQWYWRGLWYGRYIYAKHYPRGVELYDLKRDPHQLRNVAYAPAYRRIKDKMGTKARAIWKCKGARECVRLGNFTLPKPVRRAG